MEQSQCFALRGFPIACTAINDDDEAFRFDDGQVREDVSSSNVDRDRCPNVDLLQSECELEMNETLILAEL